MTYNADTGEFTAAEATVFTVPDSEFIDELTDRQDAVTRFHDGKVSVMVRWSDANNTLNLGRGQLQIDWDDDGATNREEMDKGTEPFDRDSDEDGLLDGEEMNRMGLGIRAPGGCDPKVVDSDGDGLADGLELGLSHEELAARITPATPVVKTLALDSGSTVFSHAILATAAATGDRLGGTGQLLADADPLTWTDPNGITTNYHDGPDILVTAGAGHTWQMGKDKNANGKYEPAGQDWIWGTLDDEFDPNNSNSRPDYAANPDYEEASEWHDADGDGLTDGEEDTNLNAAIPPDSGETGFMDADTDDDGLSDGFESGMASEEKLPFLYTSLLSATNPDSDEDGLPDGLELGVQIDPNGMPLTLAGTMNSTSQNIVALNPYVNGRDTNKSATFTYNSTLRSCFVPSPVNVAITNPTNADTNYDSVPDGEGITIGSSNNANYNGHNPGVGLISSQKSGMTPRICLTAEHPAQIKALMLSDGTVDPQGIGTNTFEFSYQSAYDEVISPSNIIIGNSNAYLPGLTSVTKSPNSNIYTIKLTVNPTLTSPAPSTLQVVTPSHSSATIYTTSFPSDIADLTEYASASLFYAGAFGYDSFSVIPVTNQREMPVYKLDPKYISWYDVTPCPLPEHRRMPERNLALIQNQLLSSLVYGPKTSTTNSSVLSSLRELMQRYYGCDLYGDKVDGTYYIEDEHVYFPYADQDPVQLHPDALAYIERQYMFACLWSEASEPIGRNMPPSRNIERQEYRLLTGITPLSQLFYNYVTPGSPHPSRIGGKLIESLNLRENYRLRLFDQISMPFYGSFPVNKLDQGKNGDRTDNWKKVMGWRLSNTDKFNQEPWMEAVADNLKYLPPQWHMKSWHELVDSLEYDKKDKTWNPVFGVRWSPAGEEDIVNPELLRLVLQVALAGKMAMQGIFGGTGDAPLYANSLHETTASYFNQKYLWTGTYQDYPGNMHPVVNFTPPADDDTPDTPASKPNKKIEEYLSFTDEKKQVGTKIGNHWFMRKK